MESPKILSFTCHNDTYPAIDPQNAQLSMSGRSVLVTGANGTIGAATVEAFAIAGASNIVLAGRSKDKLDSTARQVGQKFEKVKLVTHTLDLSTATPEDCTSLFDLVSKEHSISTIDTIVLNAAHIHDLGSIASPDFPIDDFWKGFEINVRGNFHLVRAFISQPDLPKDATIINTTTFLAYMGGTPYQSGYAGSKLALVKLLEYVHFDRPSLRIFNFNPGCIRSPMCARAGVPQDHQEILFDSPELPANFAVWLASSEAEFLSGRTVEARWDVEEMKKAKDIIQGDDRVFRVGLQGRGFVPLVKSQLK